MNHAGLVSVSFRDRMPEELIEASARCALEAIEWGSDVHLPAGNEKAAAQLRRRCEDAGIRCPSYGSYLRLGRTGAEEYDAYLDTAAALGASTMRIWGGAGSPENLSPAEFDRLVSEAQTLCSRAQARRLSISLECHNNTVTEQYEAALRFLAAVDSPALRMYFQPNQRRDEAYNLAACRALSPYVTNVHVFYWRGTEKFPLAGEIPLWRQYLAELGDAEHWCYLEFMPDGRLESLPTEAAALREILAGPPGNR